MDETYTPPRYPVVQFLLAHGMRLAWLLALLIALCGIALGVHFGAWWWPLGGLLAAALTGTLLASYVEVLRIIADTLIPH